MKNIGISAVMISALVCPVVYATQDTVAANELQLQAKEDSTEQAYPKKRHSKKHHRKHRMHKMKRKHAMGDEETAAEKRIEQEAELTNR